MTQRNHNSAQKNSRKKWQRSLPAQGICWLSSFSLLSGGLVVAQTDAPVENLVVAQSDAQVDNIVPKAETKTPATSEQRSSSEREFTGRRTRLVERLRRRRSPEVSQEAPSRKPSRRSAQAAEPTVRTRTSRRVRQENSEPESRISRRDRRDIEIARRQKFRREAAQGNLGERRRIFATLQEENIRLANNREERPTVVEFSAPQRTNNGNTATANYQAPSSVIITGRSNRNRTVATERRSRRNNQHNQNVANRDVAPSWLRRSQAARLANNTPSRRRVRDNEGNQAPLRPRTIASAVSRNAGWHPQRQPVLSQVSSQVNNRANNRVNNIEDNTNNNRVIRPTLVAAVTEENLRPRTNANKGVTGKAVSKTVPLPNRFIPSPSNFAPDITTATSIAPTIAPTIESTATPMAPGATGMLPVPVTAENTAPRPGSADYSIPLASVLPQTSSPTTDFAYNPTGFTFPLSVPAPISSFFGWRSHPITGERRFHSGIDLAAAVGTPVLAAYTGQVEVADSVGGYGLTVILNHNNAQQTLYGHMSELLVQPGQWVEKGSIIGRVGSTGTSTGAHLHFEVRQLTSEGWVATDPGVQIEFALNQLIQSLQAARAVQATQQPGG
ncbi:MAG: M23 family metallopeptidase [Scytonematopsis contorta HA4267-MV1]|jgi:murein DD-endopeptidase MepM/ murein hydrolase activator NlpD|nr:M23 family metallopeptidase [Scytonematopsis contorta HA4267-MV1]